MPRYRLQNLLTKYAPRSIRNQGRPLKRLLDEQDRNRPAMTYFPENEIMIHEVEICRRVNSLQLPI
jgi:hypothetical protein